MSTRYDVVVVGGGPGGYVAAIRAAQLGFKTALVEGHKLGGECLNYGCIPSKAMIHVSHVFEKIANASKLGIEISSPARVNLEKSVEWKASIVKALTGGIGNLLKSNGVTHIRGTAQLNGLVAGSSVKKLRVDLAKDPYTGEAISGASGTEDLEAERVILATGSVPVQIPGFSFNGRTVLGSREALEVKQVPKKLAVIGGGFIGLELGTFFSKLGTQVTVLEASDQLLPGTDRECVDVVFKKLQRRGVKVHLNTKAKSFAEHASGGLLVQAQGMGPDQVTVEADWILLTVGRKPRTEKLGLETVGLKVNSQGQIDVNARLETSVSGVYAIGDIVGGPMLAHKASKEGLVAVESFVNPAAAMNIVALPWAIFVDPEIASVGHTEDSARAAGWTPVVAKCPFGAIGRALTTGSAEGFVKLVVDQKTDRVLGAHMVGPEVSNLVAEIALGIEMGATAQDIARTVHAHPTLPEGIMEAAEAVHGMAIHFFERKKAPTPDAKATV